MSLNIMTMSNIDKGLEHKSINAMKARLIVITAIAMMALCGTAPDSGAAPARKYLITCTQPDGSTFMGYLRGDEFCHAWTTASGRTIVKDAEGWWRYAGLAADGSLSATGSRVNAAEASLSAFSAAHETIFPKASERRRIFNENVARKPMMRNFLAQDGASTKSASMPKQKHGIVILAQFSDIPFKYTRQNFVDLLTKKGYSHNGAVGSALDYFNDQFNGEVEFSFDVSEIVTLPRKREYYGRNDNGVAGNDKNAEQMIVDACKLAAEKGTDFSKYDDDNDGFVDNVFVFFSGGDEADGAGDDCIWSHAYYLYSGQERITLRLNGKLIDSYACTAELTAEIDEYGGAYGITGNYFLAGIGTFCHEYSHTFGLPDFYDTDYEGSGGQAEALWTCTGLMDGGNMNDYGNTPPYYNAIDREYLGIGEALTLGEGSHKLEPIHLNGKYYRLETGTKDEYFLIECRSNKTLWDKHIGGKGMLVYHIDKSSNQAGKSDNEGGVITALQRWNYNEVNCRPDRQCADLVEADPNVVRQAHSGNRFSPTAAQVAKIFFPSGSHNTLGPDNGLSGWDGNGCGVQIYGIQTESDGSVSFSVGKPKEVSATVRKDVFQNAAILEIEMFNAGGEITIKYGLSGKSLTSQTASSADESGKYVVRLDGLTPRQTYKTEIYATVEGTQRKVASASFITKPVSGTYPAIIVDVEGRNDDGSFASGTKIPLVLNNAAAAKKVEWYFDGKAIDTDKEFYLTVEKTGTLKAVMTYSDGVQTSIYKKVVVKNQLQ